MSVEVATWVSAIATVILAVFAMVTARYAKKAVEKQSQEVSDQAKMLEIQGRQLAEQEKTNAEQVKVLRLQSEELAESLDERKRDAERRRGAQASRVFISQVDGVHYPSVDLLNVVDGDDELLGDEPEALTARVTVANTSDQPIYDAELRWHRGSAGHGFPNSQPLGTIMPGGEAERVREFPLDTSMGVSGAVLRFRDAAGVIWMRRPDGGLTEQVQ